MGNGCCCVGPRPVVYGTLRMNGMRSHIIHGARDGAISVVGIVSATELSTWNLIASIVAYALTAAYMAVRCALALRDWKRGASVESER